MARITANLALNRVFGQGDFLAKIIYNIVMQRKIFKTGHSLAITLSKKVLNELDLKEGDAVEIEVAGKKASIQKTGHHRQLDLGLKIKHKLGEKL